MPKEYFSVLKSSSLSGVPAGAKIHVVGVCGVAMAQLALTLSSMGYEVSGSDKEFYEPMGGLLKKSKVKCLTGYAAGNIPSDVSLVVIGNAVSYGNPEVNEIEAKGYPYSLFPKLLFETVISGGHSFVVTGTHGKSTTSALLAFVLTQAGKDPGYFVGAVAKDLPESFRRGKGGFSVVEGDEYDSAFFAKVPKFSFYQPNTAIVTSVEYDHADIYPDLQSINKEFSKLINSRTKDALAICCTDFPNLRELVQSWRESATCGIVTYGVSEDVDYRLLAVNESGGIQEAEILLPSGKRQTLRLKIPGVYNVKNAVAVMIAAERAGISFHDSAYLIEKFTGLKRRQDVRAEKGGITLIEDFAHHPTAVKETLAGIRARHGARKIWAIFEPRSNTSRRRVFQQEYVQAFSVADRVILSEVNARSNDKAEDLLDVKELSDSVASSGTKSMALPNAEAILNEVSAGVQKGDIVVVMSNGSFGGLIDMLVKEIEKR